MKRLTQFLLVMAFVPMLAIFSCGTTYYQMYEVDYVSEPVSPKELTINYNLWAEGGRMAFSIMNNTDNVITILWDKSFFVLNGLSIPYYENTEYTQTSGTSIRDNRDPNVVYGSAESATKKQERSVMIAPQASNPFITYKIQEKYIHIAQLDAKPSNTESKSFLVLDSPVKFSNFVTYQVEGEAAPRTLKHDFYVKVVSNWHPKKFAEAETWSRPGEAPPKRKYFEEGPLRFFVTYYIGY